MKRITLFTLLIILLLITGCEYQNAGALETKQWIGNVQLPYEGIVANEFYSFNGTDYVIQAGNYYCSLKRGNAQIIGQPPYSINWTIENNDLNNMHNNNAARINILYGGTYLINTNVQLTTGGASYKQLYIVVNGNRYEAYWYTETQTTSTIVQCSLMTKLYPADYFEIWCSSSSGPLSVIAANKLPRVEIQRIGK